MSDDVARFFDREADDYCAVDRQNATHRYTADRLQAALAGRVLAVGGLWAGADPSDLELAVADISPEMLERYRRPGITTHCCDARELPFADQTFDHVVFPLILHHITDRGGRAAQCGVRAALAEAARVLLPGGRVWIREWSVAPIVYRLELALAPLTRRLLARGGVPLVIMHSGQFYRQALASAGFADIALETIPRSADRKPTDWIRPVIGLPWLAVPRFAVPVTPILISAVK